MDEVKEGKRVEAERGPTIVGMFRHSECVSACTFCSPFGIWYVIDARWRRSMQRKTP